MIFNTWEFAAFAVPLFLVYWKIPLRLRSALLVVGGLAFYLASSFAYTLLIVLLAATTYAVALQISRLPDRSSMRRVAMILGVGLNTATLVFFKYTNLLATTINSLVPTWSVPHMTLAIPLALSFFTFEFIHFLVDVYIGKIRELRAWPFAQFALFFPTLVAGPIKRYQNFEPQTKTYAPIQPLVRAAGIYRIGLGLAKKAILADSLSPLTQPLLTPSPLYNHADYWMAVLAYTAKIYFDFSGYSDIAIGLSALLGFSILENFDRPYWSASIAEFWRRWHISLSSWIRDYIFIPLGGSRHGRIRTAANLTMVMALAGLWHGAAWHFVVWGLWNGLGLAVHRGWSMSPVAVWLRSFPQIGVVYVATTFLFVALGWVLFASPTAAIALEVYRSLW